MPSDDLSFPTVPLGLASRDTMVATAARIADDSERLRSLARRQHLAMLDYLLGMVVIEAQQLLRQVTRDERGSPEGG